MTTLQELLEQWEARSKDALPTDAMLINKHIRELRAALAQQGERKNCPQPEICGSKECEFCRDTAAPAQQPVAYITDTEQGPMVWTPEMYDEACTYCDDGEFPVPLYTVAPRPTSGDYALGYAEGFNDACKPAPQPVHQGERAELIRRLLAIANTEANEVADALNEAADMLQSAQPAQGVGRTNPGDETGGAVERFGWQTFLGKSPEIIPATNGSFVWYSDYLKLWQSAQPVAQYDKTEMNAFVTDLYQRKSTDGQHGFYETMFHVVHKAIARVGIREVK